MIKPKRIYYIGDWAVQIGPVYAETPFNHAAKGLDFINYGHWLVDGLQSTGEFEVTSVPTWDFYNMKPGEYESVLADYDIIVFSDVEAKNFQLHPQFFNRHLFGTKILTFPDRVKLTVEAVKAGLHVIFMGGWLGFNGEMGQPQFPRLRSDPTAISGASRKKRFPSSPPQGHGLGKTSKKRASTNQFHKSKRFPSSQPKSDGWAGDYYLGERTKLFSFIFENNTSGVIGISGDVHRSDIYKLPIGKERYFDDFTSGSLSRTHRTPPNPLPQEMIHSYGKKTDNNM